MIFQQHLPCMWGSSVGGLASVRNRIDSSKLHNIPTIYIYIYIYIYIIYIYIYIYIYILYICFTIIQTKAEVPTWSPYAFFGLSIRWNAKHSMWYHLNVSSQESFQAFYKETCRLGAVQLSRIHSLVIESFWQDALPDDGTHGRNAEI